MVKTARRYTNRAPRQTPSDGGVEGAGRTKAGRLTAQRVFSGKTSHPDIRGASQRMGGKPCAGNPGRGQAPSLRPTIGVCLCSSVFICGSSILTIRVHWCIRGSNPLPLPLPLPLPVPSMSICGSPPLFSFARPFVILSVNLSLPSWAPVSIWGFKPTEGRGQAPSLRPTIGVCLCSSVVQTIPHHSCPLVWIRGSNPPAPASARS